MAGLAALGLALLPLAALVVEWNGLVPPSADPASCGLCTDRPGVGRDALTLRTVGFTIALLAVYAAIVLGPATWRRIRLLRSPAGRLARSALDSPAGKALAGALRGERPRRLPLERLIALAAVVGVLLLLIAPLEYRPVQPGIPGDAGWLWRVADSLPTLLGSSLVFWALVPLGAVAAALLVAAGGLGCAAERLPGRLPARSPPRRADLPEVLRPLHAARGGPVRAAERLPHPPRLRGHRIDLRSERGLRAVVRRLSYWISSMSITKTSVSFGPITGGEPWAP